MNCIQCEGPMTSRRESYDYSACGLPVVLDGVVVHRCARCGEHEVALPRIEELHRVIARHVIRKPMRLSPADRCVPEFAHVQIIIGKTHTALTSKYCYACGV